MVRRSMPLVLVFALVVAVVGPAAPAAARPSEADRKLAPALLRRFERNPVQEFVVEFAARADLRSAASIRGFARRGRFVRQSLVATAGRSQAAARRVVAETSGASATSYWITNVLVVRGREELARTLAGRPEVARVRPVKVYPLVKPVKRGTAIRAASGDPEWGVAKIRADEAWDDGVVGSGIVVANVDTGVDYLHPALVNQYRGNNGDGTFTHDYNWWDPTGVCDIGEPPFSEPCDNAAHGTHVMGTIAGGDGPGPFTPDIGVAPGARWIAAKGCEDFFCTETSLLSSGQFLVAPTDLEGNNPDASKRPHVVNNSWGSDDPGDTFYLGVVEAWRAAGIIPVFANGNAGDACGTVGTPGNFEEVLGIGATDINDDIADFSSRGPAPDGRIKPEVSAPGVDVVSSVPGEGYDSFSGTSMATPHTVGAIALILSAEAALIGQFDAVKNALGATAVDRIDEQCGGDADGDPNNVYGEGRIDALAAVDLVKTGGTLSGNVTDADTSAPIAGARVTANDGDREFSTVTDASGAYELFLAAGTYTVSADAFGYAGQIAPGVEIVMDQVTTQSFALTALPRFTVSGIVRAAEDATSLSGVKVQALAVPVDPVFTDDAGAYSLTLPIGTYTLQAAGGGCTETATAEVTLLDHDVPQDFSLFRKIDDFGHGCDAIAFDWVDAPIESGLFGDEFSGRLNLPFEFPFYGESYSRVFISDNGYINFLGADTFNSFPSEIPSTSDPNAAVYPLWQDLFIDEGGSIDYGTVGDAPDRAFVMEFTGISAFGASELVDFEVKLWEEGRIDLLYGDNAANPGDGRKALIGIENAAGTDALQFSFLERLLGPNEAYRFEGVPVGFVSGTVTDANDGLPIQGAAVTAEPSGRTATTDADGDYRLQLRPGTYSLTASSGTYTPMTTAVSIVDGEEVTASFPLRAPVAGVAPTELSAEVALGETATETITVENTGSAPLEWNAKERSLGVDVPELPPAPQGIFREPVWAPPSLPTDVPRTPIPQAVPSELLQTIIDDPAGDAVGSVDITTVRAGSDGTALASMAIDFAAGTPMGEIGGFVFLDTDQDSSTGFPPEDFFGKPTQDIGVDFFADMFGVSEGYVLIVDAESFEIVAEVPAAVEGQTVSFDVPLEAIGGDDGSIDVAMVLGDFFQPTDWAPDVGHGTIQPFVDLPWIAEEPESGTIPPGGSQDVAVTLGSADLGPGTYSALLAVLSNAPKQPQLLVDVRLTVGLPADFGSVEGTVFDAHDGEPIEGVDVTLEAEGPHAPFVDRTGGGGGYSLFGPAGTWPLRFEKDGYVAKTRQVTIVAGHATTADAALHARQPHATVSGGPFRFIRTAGRQATGTITVRNPGGHADLTFSVGEVEVGGPEGAEAVAGKGTWLARSEQGVEMRRNGGGSGVAHPSSFLWEAAAPTQDINVLLYADDVIHVPPDSLVDQALQTLGLSYTAHYDGDWEGFEQDLETGEWDLVLVANDNFAPGTSVFDALLTYVEGGGSLVFHGWTIGDEPDHPLWEALGFYWAGDDNDPPDPVYWWLPGHPVFNVPESVPELTALDGEIYGTYGQHVEPIGGEALAGYTVPGPDPEEAALILGPNRTTMFKGFLDGQNSADLDEDGLLDGAELWTNLIDGIQGGFLSEVSWLSVEPAEGTVPRGGRANLKVKVDSTGLAPGLYQALVSVQTNDPDNRSSMVSVDLIVPAVQKGVNSGGGAYTSRSGARFKADQAYAAGGFGYVGESSVRRTGDGIAGTRDDPLYRNKRIGMQKYRFDVRDGTYLVALHFAELSPSGVGDRVFNVSLEGREVLSGFDVFRRAGGAKRALQRSFVVRVVDGHLDIRFTAPRAHRAIINAILVTKLPRGAAELFAAQR
jgi:subtilisin family serine protease